MLGIALGAASFLVIFWVDVAAVRKVPFLSLPLWAAGCALFLAGILETVRHSTILPLPLPARAIGFALTGLFFLLLLYSLFIELALFSRRGSGRSGLVTWGTYALCRHPGVLWLAGLLIGLFLTRGSLLLLAAFPLWVGLDIVYVLLQEKLFFPVMFAPDYGRYQETVPLLVPTARSLRACAATIFRKITAE
jgi:protein-S-isoprenylcysteine O-methyltransferase Ste14